MRKIAIVALIACLPSLAAAQIQTLPPETVLGRLGTSPGPAQAIPFTTLANSLNLIVQTVGVHKVAVGGASTLTGIGPLTTGQLLIGVTGSDPAACTNCSLAGTLAAVNEIKVSGAVTPLLTINKSGASGNNYLLGTSVGVARWSLILGNSTAEAGANAGSDFGLVNYNDAGAAIATPLFISRATGVATFGAGVASTTPSTGTVVIGGSGGLGVGGNIFSGGDIAATSALLALHGTATLFGMGTGVAMGMSANATTLAIRAGTDHVIVFQDNAGASTFGVMFAGGMNINGASSGAITIAAPAAAGSNVMTLPAANDTFMGKATPDVMTNKTLDTAGTGNVFKINGTTISAIGGNTAKVGTVAGVLVSGHCVAIDANLNFIDAGGACTTGGAGGTVGAGTTGELAYYPGAGTSVLGNANITISTGDLTLGIAGSVVGSVSFGNVTSGTVKLASAAGALGSSVLTLPTATDTLVGKATTDTLTNKTIDGNNNTLTVLGASQISGTIPASNLPAATDSNVWSATASVFVTSAVLNSAGAIVALSDAATIATDMATGINFSVTLGGNRTLDAPTNTQAGRSGCYFFTQDGTGTRTLDYNAVWKFSNGTKPILSTAIGAVDMLCYVVKDSTHIIGNLTAKVQ